MSNRFKGKSKEKQEQAVVPVSEKHATKFSTLPIFDRVLVKKLVAFDDMTVNEEDGTATTKGGLVVPQGHVESRPEAEIIMIGIGCSPYFKRWAHVGDKVLLGENTGEPWDEYFVVFEEEILALLFEDDSQRDARMKNIELVNEEEPLPPLVQFLRQ